MNTSTTTLVAEVITALMSAAGGMPAVLTAGQTAVELLTSHTDPTPDQESAIRLALDDAHNALQQA